MTALPTVAAIKRAVAAEYGVTPADLDGRSRLDRIAEPRTVAMLLAYRLTRHSKAHISVMFNRHPNTAGINIARLQSARPSNLKALRKQKRVKRLTLDLIGGGSFAQRERVG